MENNMNNLEELLDTTKFASIDVAIQYGDNLLKSINDMMKHMLRIFNSLKKEETTPESEEMLKALQEAGTEAQMMRITIEDMKSYLSGYKAKKEPPKVEDVAATKDWGFTEEELEKLKKYKQPDFTPEEQAKLQKYDPSKFTEE
jgi:transposase-like protein